MLLSVLIPDAKTITNIFYLKHSVALMYGIAESWPIATNAV